jgi:hypothetical protein
MPGEDELKREAARELRGIDKRPVFWVDIAVAAAPGASAEDRVQQGQVLFVAVRDRGRYNPRPPRRS